MWTRTKLKIIELNSKDFIPPFTFFIGRVVDVLSSNTIKHQRSQRCKYSYKYNMKTPKQIELNLYIGTKTKKNINKNLTLERKRENQVGSGETRLAQNCKRRRRPKTTSRLQKRRRQSLDQILPTIQTNPLIDSNAISPWVGLVGYRRCVLRQLSAMENKGWNCWKGLWLADDYNRSMIFLLRCNFTSR